MDWLELLKNEDIETFNLNRPDRLDLFGADLSGFSLKGVDLSYTNLEKADLSDCNLEGAFLNHTNLNGTDLTGTNLRNIDAERSSWSESYIEDADFSFSNLSYANFNDAELHNVDFAHATLYEARLKRCDIQKSSMRYINAEQARFSGSQFTGSDLSFAVLKKAKLAKCNFSKTLFSNSDLSESLFAEASLKQLTLEQCDLRNSNFHKASLKECLFESCDLTSADLTEVPAEDQKFKNCTLRDLSSLIPAETPSLITIKRLDLLNADACLSSEHLLLYWKSTELDDASGEEITPLRLTIIKTDAQLKREAFAHSVSAQRVQSCQLFPTSNGWDLIMLEQRSSGIYLRWDQISFSGEISLKAVQRVSFPVPNHLIPNRAKIYKMREGYALFSIQGRVLIFLVSHKGQFFEGGYSFPTALKLFDHLPIVQTKGGSLTPLGLHNTLDHFQTPKELSLEQLCITPIKDSFALSWLPKPNNDDQPDPGLWIKAPNQEPELLFTKTFLLEHILVNSKGVPWILFKRSSNAPATPLGMELPPDMPAEIMEELMAEFMDEMLAEEMPIPLSSGSNVEWVAYNYSTCQEYILCGPEGLIEENFLNISILDQGYVLCKTDGSLLLFDLHENGVELKYEIFA